MRLLKVIFHLWSTWYSHAWVSKLFKVYKVQELWNMPMLLYWQIIKFYAKNFINFLTLVDSISWSPSPGYISTECVLPPLHHPLTTVCNLHLLQTPYLLQYHTNISCNIILLMSPTVYCSIIHYSDLQLISIGKLRHYRLLDRMSMKIVRNSELRCFLPFIGCP